MTVSSLSGEVLSPWRPRGDDVIAMRVAAQVYTIDISCTGSARVSQFLAAAPVADLRVR